MSQWSTTMTTGMAPLIKNMKTLNSSLSIEPHRHLTSEKSRVMQIIKQSMCPRHLRRLVVVPPKEPASLIKNREEV